jgi:hypothetical protein
MHGKDITIPKGHEVTVYTNTDYDLKSAPVPVAESPRTPQTDSGGVRPPQQRSLRLISKPAGATVLIDGKYVNTTPTPEIKLEEGIHSVVLRRIGYVDQKFEVNGTEGTVSIELKLDTDPNKPKIVGLN